MFDNLQLIQIPLEKMVKKSIRSSSKAQESSLYSPSVQKQQIYEECQEQSTIPPHQSTKKEEDVVVQMEIKKSLKIKKDRKKRKFNPQGRFLKEHRKRFFLFPFYFATLFPTCKISWQNWKPSGYFIKMSEFLSNIDQSTPNKTPEQCKSFDERQKKQIYTNVDLLQAAFIEMKEGQLDQQSINVLRKYIQKMETKSDYMSFLSQYQFGQEERMQSHQLLMEIQSEGVRRNNLYHYPESITDLIFNEFLDERARVF